MRYLQARIPLYLLMVVWVHATACTPVAAPPPVQQFGTVQVLSALQQASSAEQVAEVRLTISAPDMSSRTVPLTNTNGQWGGLVGQIPAGTQRTFSAVALDGAGTRLFEGQTTGVTILAGQTVAVALTLQQVNAPPPYGNSVPSITSLIATPATVTTGGSVSLVATATDRDEGDTLSYAWTAPTGSFSAPTSPSTSWTAPSEAGPASLTLTVTDSKGATATIRLTITVRSTSTEGSSGVNVSFNSWPAVTRIVATPYAIELGETTTLTATASDNDGDTLSYEWQAGCAGTWTDPNQATARFTPSAQPDGDGCGVCPLTVTTLDGRGGRGTGTLSICIGPRAVARFPPDILYTFQSESSAPAGGTVALRVEVQDAQGSELTFSWQANVGTLGAPTHTPAASEVVWTAPDCVLASTTPTIQFTVTNSLGLSNTTQFTVPGAPVCDSMTCEEGRTDCGGLCADLATDRAHCGACNQVCRPGELCQAGACTCAPGQTLCFGACTNLSSDLNHCGACGRRCAAGASCSNGACVTADCTATDGSCHTLAPGAMTYRPWEQVTAHWTAPANHHRDDWVGLYRVGTPIGGSAISWQRVGSNTSGTLTFAAPTIAGTYEFRYGLAGSQTILKTSIPFAVELAVSSVHSLAADASTYRIWEQIRVQWAAPAHHHGRDWVGLYRVGTPIGGSAVSWQHVGSDMLGTMTFAAPVIAGTYEFRYGLVDSQTIVRTSAPFTVELATSDVHSLTPGASLYGPWEQITVQWAAPAHHNNHDQVRLYRVGAPDSAPLAAQDVGGDSFGTLTFAAPVTAGSYEFRYAVSAGRWGPETIVKASAPFTVELTTSDVHSLTPGASLYRPWEQITVQWTAPVHHNGHDQVRLYRVGAPDDAPLDAQEIGVGSLGTQTFAAPTAAGTYEFRYAVAAGRWGPYTIVKASAPFTVELVTSDVHSLTTNASTYRVGATITVQWTAPAHHHRHDQIRLYLQGAPNNAPLARQDVGPDAFGTLTFTAPATAGTYELRYALVGSDTIVRASAPFTVNN